MRLRSSAFAEGQRIPVKYARDGENLSPPLEWSDVPGDVRELALLFENVTPESRPPFTQWVIYGISPETTNLPEGLRHKQQPDEPAGAVQGTNAIGNVGYDGPQGTVGRTFHYRFRLLALDEPLDLPPGADRDAVLTSAADRLVGEAELHAEFERPR